MRRSKGKFSAPAGQAPSHSSPQPDTLSDSPVKTHLSYGATFLSLWLAVAFPELILHIFTAKTMKTCFNSGFILPLLFAAVPALILFTVLVLIPSRKVSHGINIGYHAVSFILCASQLIYYKIFGTFYSAYSMSRGGQVLQFWEITQEAIKQNMHILVLMALPLILLCILGWKFLLR